MPRRRLLASALLVAVAGCSALDGLDKAYVEVNCFPPGSVCAGDGGGAVTNDGAIVDGTMPLSDAPGVDGSAGGEAGSDAGTGAESGLSESGIETPQLSVGSTALDFNMVTVGQTVAPGTIDVTNVGSEPTAPLTTALTGAAFSVVSDGCKGTALAPGAVCHIQIALDDSTAGMPMGTFTITDTASDAITVQLGADVLEPGTLTIAPQSQDFKSWVIGTMSPSQIFTVTNTGMANSGVLSVALDPTNGTLASEFPVTDGCSGKTLMPNGTCAISVLLDPASAGPKSASLVVNASPGGPATASLVGTGLAPTSLTISPTSFPFATTAVGQASAPETFTVTNMGDVASSALTTALSFGTGTATTEFAIASNACAGVMLAGRTSCAIGVTFNPATYGNKSASLNINGGPPTATMTGTGQDSVALTVTSTGAGGGTITDGTGAINCGAKCSAQYTRTTSDPIVMLTATPNATSTFAGWSGGNCSGTGTCTVTLSAATMVTAQFNAMQETLTVNLRAFGGLSGSIASSPAGISCSASVTTAGLCTTSASFNVGSTVTLTVTGLGSAALSAWLPTTCTGATCSVVMNAPQTVNYTATANNLIFVTSSTFTGDLGGLAGATTLCKNAASIAGLPGHYVPWLATSTVNATTALGSARGWLRTDGLPFADTIGTAGGTTGLVNGQIYYPPEINELGNAQPGFAWTGANWDGSVDSGYSCSDWVSGSTSGSAGNSERGSYGWTDATAGYCGNDFSLYCLGTDLSTAVTITKQTGRNAFVSKGAFTTTGGSISADTLCKNEATSANLPNPGNFLAFLASNGTPAASRFNQSGANWVRPDGLPLASSIANLLAGKLLAPPTVHADGSYIISPDLVWTGASDPNTAGTAATTCTNWGSNASGVDGEQGLASETTAPWFGNFATAVCASPFSVSVYCFEN